MASEKPLFDIKKPFITKRAFNANGKKFLPGMDFPWRKMSISNRRVGQLFDSDFLTHDSSAIPPLVEIPPEDIDGYSMQPGEEIEIFVPHEDGKEALEADLIADGSDEGVTVTVAPDMFELKEDGFYHPTEPEGVHE